MNSKDTATLWISCLSGLIVTLASIHQNMRYIHVIFFFFRCATTECADILNNEAEKTINGDALERNLASFGLERNVVPSDGNCCFSSIISQLYKIKESATMSKEYADFITELGKTRDAIIFVRIRVVFISIYITVDRCLE